MSSSSSTAIARGTPGQSGNVPPRNHENRLNLKTVDAERLRVHLLEKYGVGLISLGKHDLRVAFSCIEKQDIQELFDTVLKGVQGPEAVTHVEPL